MTGYLDRERAAAEMAAADLHAILVCSPEAVLYATGVAAGGSMMWRQAGPVMAVVPRSADEPIEVVCPEFDSHRFRAAGYEVLEHAIWADRVTVDSMGDDAASATEEVRRPETFDRERGFELAASILRRMGIRRVGIESRFLTRFDFELLEQAVPHCDLLAFDRGLARLRAIKSEKEIRILRHAVALAEHGLVKVRDNIGDGATGSALSGAFQSAVRDRAPFSGSWDNILVGPSMQRDAPVTAGGVIRADCGAIVDGYTSDSARTFVCGEPDALTGRVFDALRAAFEVGLDKLQPGRPLREAYLSAMQEMHRRGFPSYSRGHLGHSVGSAVGIEEWPFISATTHATVAPGMVLAFELPWYVEGLGALMIEDQVLISDRGPEPMNRLPRDLIGV